MSGRRRFYGVSIRRSISTVCPHRCVMNSRRACRRTRCRSKVSRRTLGLRKGGYNQQDRGGQPESALHFHGCLPFFHNMRRPHYRTGCTILGQLLGNAARPGTKSVRWCLHLSPASRPVKVIVPPRNNDLRCFSRYAGCAINVRPKGVRIWLRNKRFCQCPVIWQH